MNTKYKLLLICITLLLVLIIALNFYQRITQHTKTFTSERGRQGEFIIYPVKNSNGILLWLHGDGAFEYFNPESKEYLEGKNGLKEISKNKKLTLVVPKTPSLNYDTWWEEGDINSDYLIDLINSLPNHNNLWICGFSGGSEITSYWLIEKLRTVNIDKGGAVLFGGGGSPKTEGISNHVRKVKIIKGDFPIYWIVGKKDTGDKKEDIPFNALKVSQQGEKFYRNQGWETKRIVLDGYGHLLTKNNEGQYGKFLDEIIP